MNLEGWENSERLQFTINTLGMDVEVVPFSVSFRQTTGVNSFNNAYIFDKLSSITSNSTPNKQKVAFSQIVDGEEVSLICELDVWNHTSRNAVFWVRPKKYYSNNINIFYVYFDKDKSDNINYLSETNLAPARLFRNKATCSYDTNDVSMFTMLKVDGVYKMWYMGNTTRWHLLQCTSTDLITWTTPTLAFNETHTYDTINIDNGTVLYDEGIYKMWYSASDGSYWRIMYCSSVDGVVWSNHQLVVTYGQTYYSTGSVMCCSVIKVGNAYKMWYEGSRSGSSIRAIIYCDSTNGITWSTHQPIMFRNDIDGGNNTSSSYSLRPSCVLYKDSVYHMWLDFYESQVTSKWNIYYATSDNGINWKNIKIFMPLGLEGVYDTQQLVYLNLLVEGDIYHFFYSGGAPWRILYSKSLSLSGPRTAAQAVWGDDFFSIHHLNPSYGYRDSTNNKLNIISMNSVVGSTSNLGNASLLMQNYDSYINFGNNSKYSFASTTSMILAGKFNSGNIVVNKGYYNNSTISLIYYNNDSRILNMSESFTGPDYSQPSSLVWKRTSFSSTCPSYILNNTLFMNVITSPIGNYNGYTSAFALVGDFDIQVDFSNLFAQLTWYSEAGPELTLTCPSENTNSFLKAPIYGPATLLFRVGSTLNGSWQGDVGVGRSNNYGAFRYVRTGTTVQAYFKDGPGAWQLLRTFGFSDKPLVVGLGQYCPTNMYNNYDNFIINYGTIQDQRGIIIDNSFSFGVGEGAGNNTKNLNIPVTLNNTWDTYVMSKSSDKGANSTLTVSGINTLSFSIDSLYTNNTNLLIGAASGAINGAISEVWFANKIFTPTTVAFIDKVLKDAVVLYSRYYIQGYVTEYNKASVHKVAVYSTVDNQLLGITYPSPVDGYYYCEVPYLVECIVLALDGDKYNHNILGKVLPKSL